MVRTRGSRFEILADFGVLVEREEVVMLICPHRCKNRGKCDICVVTCRYIFDCRSMGRTVGSRRSRGRWYGEPERETMNVERWRVHKGEDI